ncbi:hypothetical protein M885DRAFT_73868 [Pelagophyceae sp. CCMP2097]|nr:hypothetical protein M885DRAFT_73868 [Pelagophyceae sp. CCMP2097]
MGASPATGLDRCLSCDRRLPGDAIFNRPFTPDNDEASPQRSHERPFSLKRRKKAAPLGGAARTNPTQTRHPPLPAVQPRPQSHHGGRDGGLRGDVLRGDKLADKGERARSNSTPYAVHELLQGAPERAAVSFSKTAFSGAFGGAGGHGMPSTYGGVPSALAAPSGAPTPPRGKITHALVGGQLVGGGHLVAVGGHLAGGVGLASSASTPLHKKVKQGQLAGSTIPKTDLWDS